jgi:hypothetical protein
VLGQVQPLGAVREERRAPVLQVQLAGVQFAEREHQVGDRLALSASQARDLGQQLRIGQRRHYSATFQVVPWLRHREHVLHAHNIGAHFSTSLNAQGRTNAAWFVSVVGATCDRVTNANVVIAWPMPLLGRDVP